jgi:PAS domain-containing protein
VWDLYRGRIIVLTIALLVQSLLIVGLLIQSRRRRRAEESLRYTEERMSLAVESTNLGLWELDRHLSLLGYRDMPSAAWTGSAGDRDPAVFHQCLPSGRQA